MPNQLRTGREILAAKRKSFAAEEVTYSRGGQTCPLQATFSTSTLKLSSGGGGFTFKQTDRDFIFPAADLQLGGSQAEPAPDDRITDADGNVWRVMDIPGEQCWKPNDGQGVSIRVHCMKD